MSVPTYVFAKTPEEIASYVNECWEGQQGFRNFDPVSYTHLTLPTNREV